MNDYLDILRELENHHALFGRFWSIGSIVEDKKIPTACITFNRKTGEGIQFKINPTFWESLDLYKRIFVIAHECLHVYLEHGRRMKYMDPKLANIAADVVVNHYLVDGFGFDRNKIEGWENYMWLDTVFPDDPNVRAHESLEYYYQILLNKSKSEKQDNKDKNGGGGGSGSGEPETVDSHEGLEEITDEVLQEMANRLSQEEVENFQEVMGNGNPRELEKADSNPGSTAGSLSRIIKLGRVVKKRKWETVVKDVLGRFAKEKDVVIEQWAHHNRRLAAFPAGDLMLPSEIDETVLHRDRIDVWCFQDTSGSCVELAERFLKALASIPDDKFRVRVFCFDTKVYETSLKTGKLYGFGGTTFSCIEDHVQHLIKTEKGCLYPSVIFLVTDGFGNNVSPQHPDRWHWFLAENNSRGCIPSRSKVYELENFE